MASVAWSRQAARDLNFIYAYISQFDAPAAVRIINALLDAGNSLKDFPNRGRPGRRGRRELPSVPPYVIRYVAGRGGVTIQTVKHGARRPD